MEGNLALFFGVQGSILVGFIFSIVLIEEKENNLHIAFRVMPHSSSAFLMANLEMDSDFGCVTARDFRTSETRDASARLAGAWVRTGTMSALCVAFFAGLGFLVDALRLFIKEQGRFLFIFLKKEATQKSLYIKLKKDFWPGGLFQKSRL